MEIIPAIDQNNKGITTDKIVVLYTANEKGEFPASFNAGFIPSSISLRTEYFVGYTNILMNGFNMMEISDDVAKGLQSFDIINGEFKRYDRYGLPNPNDEKLEIVLSDTEIVEQLVSKKVVFNRVITNIYNKKFDVITQTYGAETETWSIQLSEAKEFTIDNNADVPFVTNLAAIRGLTKQELVDKIIVKATEYSTFSSTLLGQKQVIQEQIKNTLTDADMIALYETILTI